MKNFEQLKIEFDEKNRSIKEFECFLPVHTKLAKIENNFYKKDGTYNEQFYKWQFLEAFVGAGLCSKDYIRS